MKIFFVLAIVFAASIAVESGQLSFLKSRVPSHEYPLYEVYASAYNFYDAGYQVVCRTDILLQYGEQTRYVIQESYRLDKVLQDILIPWSETIEGELAIANVIATHVHIEFEI